MDQMLFDKYFQSIGHEDVHTRYKRYEIGAIRRIRYER